MSVAVVRAADGRFVMASPCDECSMPSQVFPVLQSQDYSGEWSKINIVRYMREQQSQLVYITPQVIAGVSFITSITAY